jgi:hypothetical protein
MAASGAKCVPKMEHPGDSSGFEPPGVNTRIGSLDPQEKLDRIGKFQNSKTNILLLKINF